MLRSELLVYYLIPEHTTPGKRSVKIHIFPSANLVGYRLTFPNNLNSSFIADRVVTISHNGKYQIEVLDKDQHIERVSFSISFLSKKPVFDGGDGSLENPYQISTVDQLNAIRLNLGAHYILTSDIDCSCWGISWVPVGKYVPRREDIDIDKAFHGTLNGSGNIIRGLCCVSIKDKDCVRQCNDIGLLGCCANATVQNLCVLNCQVYGTTNVGCLTSEAQNCRFENCHVVGTVHGDDWVGGLTGNTVETVFYRCSFTGKLSAKYEAAGLCRSAKSICDCEVNAEISSYSPTGLCSSVDALIEHCIVRGVMTGCCRMNGICFSTGTNTKVYNCICALNCIKIESTNIFTDSSASFIDTSPGDQLFWAIDGQDCSDSEYMNTEYQNNFHLNSMQIQGKMDWLMKENTDGIPISNEQFSNREFLKKYLWDFVDCWIMSENGPHLNKIEK